MPDEDSYIRARFFVTKNHVTIYAKFHDINVTFRWKRTGNPELTRRHIRTFIANLDQMVDEGLREVVIQAETKDLDQEWADMDEPPAQEEPSE